MRSTICRITGLDLCRFRMTPDGFLFLYVFSSISVPSLHRSVPGIDNDLAKVAGENCKEWVKPGALLNADTICRFTCLL